MRRWLLLLLFIPLFGIFLKEKCREGSKGDFIFYRQGQQIIYISIYDQTPETVVIEELHTSDANPNLNLKDPLAWIRLGAKGNSQWILYELDSETGEVLEAFNPPKRSFFSFGEEVPILSRLFLTNWEEMPDNRRKKVPKTQKIWSPVKRLFNEVIPIEKSKLWRVYWPKDGSALEGFRIDLHTDPTLDETFPYQIEVHDKLHPLARFQQIHQGKNAPQTTPYFPRRHPSFTEEPTRKGNFLYAELECGKGFAPFNLFLEEVSTHQLFPVIFEAQRQKDLFKLKILLPPELLTEARTYRLTGKTTGKHQSRFDSIEVFGLN